MAPNRHKPPLWVRIREFPGRMTERLSELGGSIVAAIERPFAWIGSKMLRATEHVEGVDSILGRIGGILIWPLVALWRLLVRILEIILPESVRNALTAPFRMVGAGFARLGHLLWAAVEALNLDAPVRWLVWLLQPVWRPFAAVGGFLIAWISTRNFRQLLWGLPAFLLAGPLVFAASWRMVMGHDGVAAGYRLASKQAVEAKDFKAAQFYDRKLAELGDDTKVTDYRRALALAEQDKFDEAYAIINRLSNVDEPTFPAAHAWIVQMLFAGQLEKDPQKSHDLAGKHLDALDKLGVQSPQLSLLRGLWLAGDQQPDKAAEALKPLMLKLPEAALARMEIHIQQRNIAEARDDALALRKHIERLKSDGQLLAAQHYRWLAMAEEVLGNDDELADALRGWLKIDPNDETAKLTLAEVYRRQYDRLVMAAAPPIERLSELLCDAARHPASRIWAEAQVAQIMRSRDALPTAKSLAERLESSADTPPVIIEEMGTWLVLQGDAAGAKRLLRRSLAADSSNAIAWNNLAWALGEGESPDLDEALKAVEKAIELSPGEYRFRETRGQIYAKQRRWNEAIEDLEASLNAMPGTPGIHKTLAAAYEAIGDKDLAAIHRNQSQ